MKKLLLSVSMLSIVGAVQAQRYLGVSTGNYNVINSMYLNPANLGGCEEKLSIGLFSLNVGVDNNLGTLASVGDIANTTGNDSGGTNIFKAKGSNDKFSMMVPSLEVRGPSIVYRINPRHTLAFSSRVRAFNEFNNFNRSLYTTINNSSSLNGSSVSASSQNFNWTAHVWSEFGLSYGGTAYDDGTIKIKIGATFRYLMGIGYLGIKGKNLDVSYTSGADSFRANNTDVEYASNIRSMSDGFTSGGSAGLFSSPNGGSGFGTDLGAIASYKATDETNAYTAMLSVAVTDIGAIKYKTSYDVAITGNGYLTGSELSENVKNYEDLRNYVKGKGFSVDTGTKTKSVSLPTALVIGADYHVYKKLSVAATFIGNLAKDQNFGSKYYSQFSVTPRVETKLYTIGLPITYNTLAHNLRLGLGLRISGFFIGSDDMMANFSKNQYGYNVYFGAMVPFYRKSKEVEKYR